MKKINSKTNINVTWAYRLSYIGFFLYAFLIAKEIMPPYLFGGGILILFTIPIVMVQYLTKKTKLDSVTIGGLLFFLFLGIQVIVLGIQFSLNPDHFLHKEVIGHILGQISMYLIAKHLDIYKIKVENIVYLLIMFFLIILNLNKYGMSDLGLTTTIKYATTYQSFGRSIFIICLLSLVFINKKIFKYLLVISLATLYLNSSRTHLYLFLISGLCVFLYYRVSIKNVTKIIVLLSFCTIIFSFINLDKIIQFMQNRALFFLTDDQDGSVSLRKIQIVKGWNTILNHPILGDYGSYVKGHYMHNFLSMWVDFGLIGFLIILAMMFFLLLKAISLLKSIRKKDPEGIIKFFMCISVVVGLIASKNYMWMMIGFCFGLLDRKNDEVINQSDRPL